MSSIQCFFLDPTPLCQVYLKRIGHPRRRCAIRTSHRCTSAAPLIAVPRKDQADGDFWPHDDDRWPEMCDWCSTLFDHYDVWNVVHETIYRKRGTDETMTLRDAPPGAMWDAHWMKQHRMPGPDGRYLCVRLPDYRDWFIDGPGVDERNPTRSTWSRTGFVPYVTVNPPVKTGGWHGKLEDGILVTLS